MIFLAILLACLGLVFFFLEFFLPGSLMAILGALFLLFSLAVLFYAKVKLWVGILFFLFLILSLILVSKIALYWIHKSKKKGTFYLESDQQGFVSISFAKEMVGKRGTALTDLRPSGYVEVEGQKLQAVAKGTFVEKGFSVEVLGGSGGHLIVQEVKK